MLEEPRAFNVLITGTPGTGKTSLSQMVSAELGLTHLDTGAIVKSQKFYTDFDEQYGSFMVDEEDEEHLLDYLEPILVEGGKVLDYHSCELFPKRWFHAVIVLRVDTQPHFDRLTARGYGEAKREENMDAEIEGVVAEEAADSYDEDVLHVVSHNTLDDMCAAVELVRRLKAEFDTRSSRAAAAA